jgi:DNA-binding response OmpR family regulator
MLQLLLSQEDYEVDLALTMENALARATAESFDLYVLDRRLPDGSGLELCQRLGHITPGVPCIFYTGDAYEIHRQEALGVGAAYVPKPDIDALIDAVHRLLLEKACAAETHSSVV